MALSHMQSSNLAEILWGAFQVKTMHGHFLSDLAVRLSTLVSGTLQLVSGTVQLVSETVQLISGTVQLNKWDCPPY